jgi:hypothetical protein
MVDEISGKTGVEFIMVYQGEIVSTYKRWSKWTYSAHNQIYVVFRRINWIWYIAIVN